MSVIARARERTCANATKSSESDSQFVARITGAISPYPARDKTFYMIAEGVGQPSAWETT